MGRPEAADIRQLSLYHREGCGYCSRVIQAIQRLGVEVESRNIWRDPAHRTALIAHTGRTQVPVLRIELADGGEEWIPESADIIRFLERIA